MKSNKIIQKECYSFNGHYRAAFLLESGNRAISATHYTNPNDALNHEFTTQDLKYACTPKTWEKYYASRELVG